MTRPSLNLRERASGNGRRSFMDCLSYRSLAKHVFVWSLPLLLGGCFDSPLKKLETAKIAQPASTIALKIMGYTPSPGAVFQNIFVSNYSVVLQRGKLELSTARDGMYDSLKTRLQPTYNFNLAMADTNGHGFTDLVLYLTGVLASNQSGLVCGTPLANSSNDAFIYNDPRLPGAPKTMLGLSDCEKTFLQMDPALFDNDSDGIPDYLELRNGLNPLNSMDANLSPAGDGVSNLQKVQRHIPIDESANSQPSKLYAYNYDIQTDPATQTQTLVVTGISVLLDGATDNFIAMYITETNPSTLTTTLYSAFMLVNKPVPDDRPIPITFWGTDPTKRNNVGLVQP